MFSSECRCRYNFKFKIENEISHVFLDETKLLKVTF